uniref:Uncharacterized protein n=1 Tax=Nelumbo nucifera TaxID=4432 RepID=A0A822Z6P7_NELNU|nr:TPA_asm: hypothetical protein HUJ06_012958 [Nelumbo nucifera]
MHHIVACKERQINASSLFVSVLSLIFCYPFPPNFKMR